MLFTSKCVWMDLQYYIDMRNNCSYLLYHIHLTSVGLAELFLRLLKITLNFKQLPLLLNPSKARRL